MTIAWFATFRHGGAVSAQDLARLASLLRRVQSATRALIHTPAQTHDPYLDDGRPPALVLQLYFRDAAGLDAVQEHLQALVPEVPASLGGALVTQQIMLARAFSVPEPRVMAQSCSYLVSYEGEAEDLDAWVAHYTEHHTAVMARFPGIREIEVCTRVDWRGTLPWPHVNRMLRNKVVFDDPAGLTAALNSPVRHEMRADFALFPKFAGPVTHFPMHTVNVASSGG
ncbi:MAG TPA: hypothetical protein VGG99_02395 [Acetobacteraceae bacterium]